MKIGILIPSTSNGRSWKNYKETYLYSTTLKTFLLTRNDEHEYVFYIGIDKNDKIMDNNETKDQINKFKLVFKQIDFQFIYMTGITKGHLTVMWNRLYNKALDDRCDYFYQCGDDISFKTKGWVNDCIKVLQANKDIGLTGPLNNNNTILTQSFVSRKHYELFGFYFPEEIINWYCDDWINIVYKKLNAYFPINNHYCENIGGRPRYVVNNDNSFITNFTFNRQQGLIRCNEIANKSVLNVINKYNLMKKN
jgi:hypothetical protein